MKKLFLLLSAGVITLGAGAQNIKTQSMVRTDGASPKPLSLEKPLDLPRATPVSKPAGASNKTTAGGSRVYNYVETISALNQNISSNQVFPYMWFRPDILGAYTDPNNPNGQVADTIRFGSFASLLHPWAPVLNNNDYFDMNYPIPDGTLIGITQADGYRVDSISVGGFYARNLNNSTTVDTLRFAIVYGDFTDGSNIPESGFVSNDIRFGSIFHDSFANTATSLQGGPSVVIRDIYLTTADTGIGSTIPMFTVPVGLDIPAGNAVAVSVTFKSGDDGNYTPYTDTAFLGTGWNANNPYKYGMFRPVFFEENKGQQPTYKKGDYNAGYVKFLPPYRFQSWEIQYLPHWAFTTGDFQTEWPYVNYFITCATCKVVTDIPDPVDHESVAEVNGIINQVNAYPNPAQDFVRIPVTLSKSADVTINLMNSVGQVLQTQNLKGNSVVGEFNTATLPAGVYIYSVEADGYRTTGRLSIAR